MKRVFGKLFGKVSKKTIRNINSRIIHLPDDLLDPAAFLIVSGPMVSDVWPAIYIANTLQKVFPEKDITVICKRRDSGLFNMLRLRPPVHSYTGHPEIPDTIEPDSFPDGTVLVYPYATVRNDMQNILCCTSCGIRMAPLNDSSPYINLRVKTEVDSYPDILSQMCSALKITFDANWKPSIPEQIEIATEKFMAPVSGRMLPYIATTPTALAILEKNRVEIPLRTIVLSGRNSEFADMDRDLKTAIIADASAVVTDSDDLWGDACACEIPVVGLDRSGSFIKWTYMKPAADEREFLEAWVKLLKTGW